MIPCHVVEIETPKGVLLNGLWFGPKQPKKAIVWVHGLMSSAFARLGIVALLAKGDTAVLTFNNRGHGVVSRIRRKDKHELRIGGAREKFAECVDDIDGAIRFARKQGVKHIYLAGHSTGCQKSVFWAAKRHGGKGVKGIILLAPVSDYAAAMKLQGPQRLRRATRIARALVRKGKPRSFLPEEAWFELLEAQRFLSLNTPDSPEEIFSYFQPKRIPRTLRKVRVPILSLLAAHDEFVDRPAKMMAWWFERYVCKGKTLVIPHVGHGFKGGEKVVARAIQGFIKQLL